MFFSWISLINFFRWPPPAISRYVAPACGRATPSPHLVSRLQCSPFGVASTRGNIFFFIFSCYVKWPTVFHVKPWNRTQISYNHFTGARSHASGISPLQLPWTYFAFLDCVVTRSLAQWVLDNQHYDCTTTPLSGSSNCMVMSCACYWPKHSPYSIYFAHLT